MGVNERDIIPSGSHFMRMSALPAVGMEIDGYRLVRQIGQGGFGSVWLCRSETTQSYHALKWVAGDAGHFEQDALVRFREISQRLRSPNLIAIEHINRLPSALIYTLPLADGTGADDPTDAAWRPLTLADLLETRRVPWFSSAEILSFILPIIHATAALNEAGLVHRDIKPANILFFGGVPCLADIGLLSKDTTSLTQRGTPGFLPPSWYLESSGQPDMWGLATTLYSLLTGNHPDKMGRSGFLWPPGGKESLSAADQAEWRRLHSVILRATHENAQERFLDFRALASAVEGRSQPDRRKLPRTWVIGAVVFVVATVLAWLIFGNRPKEIPPAADPATVREAPPRAVSFADRQKELDAAAEEILVQLRKQKAGPTKELTAYRKRALAVADKMRVFKKSDAGLENAISEIIQHMDKKFSSADGTPSDESGERRTETPPEPTGSDQALKEIRDELLFLASNPPKTSLSQNAVALNRIYTTLVDDAYSKTSSVEEKLYFNDVLRPRLEQEFHALFDFKPGQIPYDAIGLNMQMALVASGWSSVDKETLAEIESELEGINKALNPDL